jgi:hypothetical protein
MFNQPATTFIPKLDQKLQEQVTSKCECKVVRKFALEGEKLMHSLCPRDIANKKDREKMQRNGSSWNLSMHCDRKLEGFTVYGFRIAY